MNKKTYLFVLLALVAGGIAGYTGSLFASPSTDDDKKQVDSGVTVRPRFGDIRPTVASSDLREKTSIRSQKSEMAKLDDTLRQYSRMSTEELWNELETLSKQMDEYYYSPNTTREILMSYIFTRLGQESPRQALALMKDEKSIFRNYRYAVLDAWGEKNPDAAMACCLEKMEEDPENSDEWKGVYIDLLAKSSTEKAMDYLLSLPPKECAEYAENLLSRIVSGEPEKMTEVMKKLLPMTKRQRWMDDFIASEWAKVDWSAAEQWIKTLPEKSRSEIMGTAVGSLPQEEALKKLGTLDEKGKLEALSRLSRALSEESPVKALDFVLNQATGEQAAKIFENGLYFFNFRDSEVSSYIDNMPTGSVKDAILGTVIRRQTSISGAENNFFNPEMEETFSLIGQISSASKKEEMTTFTVNQWMHQDPQKIKSWVEQSSLPDDKKKEFIRNCESVIKSRKGDK